VISQIDDLIALLSRLPGIGPRSARRMALAMLQRRTDLMEPLAATMARVAREVQACETCGNLDVGPQCRICRDLARDRSLICVVEQVADVWALERARTYKGLYHVLGGRLSALDGVGPDMLNATALRTRLATQSVSEVILALSATVEGQSTAHFIQDMLAPSGVRITKLAQGLPVGGAVEYLDEGTLATALRGRKEA